MTTEPGLTLVVPVWNEAESLPLLWEGLREALDFLPIEAEVLFVDDGSTDETLRLLKDLCRKDRRIKVLELVGNFGQVAALSAGFTHARGDLVATMDADLQMDPFQLKRLYDRAQEGYDVVGGWREGRHDPIFRRLVSTTVNWLNARVTGVAVHDVGCSLKIYRRRIIEALRGRDRICRYNPLLAFKIARRATEVPVSHRPRQFGHSSWRIGSLIAFNVYLWSALSAVILRLAMGVGALGALAGTILFALYVLGVTKNVSWLSAPAALGLLAFQILLIGLVGEILTRLIREVNGSAPFVVAHVWDHDNVN